MKTIKHETDLCIIGGGMSGICAAISAARHGARVVIMQDRPVFGGNASSEIRMWICGAHGDNNRETGILEEICLESLYRNPQANFSIWDSVLYEKVMAEKNIKVLMNCTCNNCEMDGSKIKSVTGWQLTSETWHEVTAKYFADCSGDSVLAEMTGADFRVGRESSGEFNESIEPEIGDKKTMGMSILFQIRETDSPQKFVPPSFANKYETDESFPFRDHNINSNYWWIEIGGENDSIHDTEELKQELLKISFGVWDHMKNHGDHGVENWVLEWIGFLPGKRESRRYVGDYIMNQNDVRDEGKFDDLIAYGGWTMDDHHPAGFNYSGKPTIFHPAPSPFGIPYRCLYSKNIENLYFAGRNISVTHAALSATRVMGTCSILGQAMGTAAAIAVEKNLSPKQVYEQEIALLKRTLQEDDCYLPFNTREVNELTKNAGLEAASSDVEAVRNGLDRPVNENDNGYYCTLGEPITYIFNSVEKVKELRFVFDSNLNRKIKNMPCSYPLVQKGFHVPETIVKEFKIEYSEDGENFTFVTCIDNNYQRLVKIPVDFEAKYIRFIPVQTWGAEHAHIFSFDVK